MHLTLNRFVRTRTRHALICFALLASSLFGQTEAPAASPRERLQEFTAQLRNSPDDQALREKIIALALTLDPKPATLDAVTLAEGAAEYAFKHAQSNADFADAAKQYEKALLLAPWLADDYFNCGVAHEKADENKQAIRSFSLYLLAAPTADDTQAVRKRIGGLQYAVQKAEDEANRPAKEAAAKEAAAKEADERAGLTDNRDGTVTDHKRLLMWQKDDDGYKRNWDDSVSYCSGLSLADHSDWHLPNREELLSFWDDAASKMGKRKTYIDTGNYFPSAKEFYYWSSTTYSGRDKDAAGRFFLPDGSVEPGLKKFPYYVRCVRRER
jgi:tetratricopeptide (TPR) repeat protein